MGSIADALRAIRFAGVTAGGRPIAPVTQALLDEHAGTYIGERLQEVHDRQRDDQPDA